MLGFMPELFPDELVFSWFSRYHMQSGALSYRQTAAELFIDKRARADIEFINILNVKAYECITAYVPFERLIMEHTMFPYYIAFCPSPRKAAATEAILKMDIKTYMNLVPIPKNPTGRYLKYCPLCVITDRKNYYETFWHRTHQLPLLPCCPIHHCDLIETNIRLTSVSSPFFCTAEEYVPYAPPDPGFSIDPIGVQLSDYMSMILSFCSTHPLGGSDAETKTSDFLSSALRTPYISSRGAKRNVTRFSNDFRLYYRTVDLSGFGTTDQIQKVFNGYRYNSSEICALAMFMGITPQELVVRNAPTRDLHSFDENIKELRIQGKSYPEIAAMTGISSDYCKKIVARPSGKKKQRVVRITAKRSTIPWSELDKQYYPIIQALIEEMHDIKKGRPQRVTPGRIERIVGLQECALRNMPKCSALIASNLDSSQVHWARSIAWASNEQSAAGCNITLSSLCKAINIRTANYRSASVFFELFADQETAERLKAIMN